jgi:hypothetical protein
MDLIAALICAVGFAAVLLISEQLQRRFFVPYLATHPTEPRQPPMVRMGLGLDDMTVGPWDFVPAWRVLNGPVPAELEGRRRVARWAFLLMPAMAVLGPVLFGVFRSPAIGIGCFAGWMIGVAFRGWGSALSVSRETTEAGLDRTTRLVLGFTMVMPMLAMILAMLLASGYRAR